MTTNISTEGAALAMQHGQGGREGEAPEAAQRADADRPRDAHQPAPPLSLLRGDGADHQPGQAHLQRYPLYIGHIMTPILVPTPLKSLDSLFEDEIIAEAIALQPSTDALAKIGDSHVAL